jgi:hypothetical protein
MYLFIYFIESCRYGGINHRVGNSLIIFSSIILWYSAFLPYHEELIEENNNYNQSDVFINEFYNFF